MGSERTAHVTREDGGAPAPSVFGIALRTGVPFGAVMGLYGAISGWLLDGTLEGVLRSWLITSLASGVLFGLLFTALIVLVGRMSGRGGLRSIRQHTVFTLAGTAPRALAIGAEALTVLGDSPREVDLATCTARVLHVRKEPLVGRTKMNVIVRAMPSGADGARLRIESEPSFAQFDFGGARRAIDEVATRVESLIAEGRVGAGALGVESLPVGAADALASRHWTLAALRSLEPDAPALRATLLSAEGNARHVVVLTTGTTFTDADARRIAAGARVALHAHARGGKGFVLVPLDRNETGPQVARSVHHEMLSHAQGYRDAAGPTRDLRRPRTGDEATTRNEKPGTGARIEPEANDTIRDGAPSAVDPGALATVNERRR